MESYSGIPASGTLDVAIMVQLKGAQTAGVEFELLRTYPLCVAPAATHPFARLKSVPLQKVAGEPLIGQQEVTEPAWLQQWVWNLGQHGSEKNDRFNMNARCRLVRQERFCTNRFIKR